MASGSISLNHVEIAYDLSGSPSEKVILLLHCFGSNRQYWDFHKEAFAGFQTLIIDVPGHGQSSLYDVDCSLELIASDISSLLDFLGINKVILGGVSMGGMISQTFTLKHPELVSALMLINTTCFISEDMHQLWRERSQQVLENGTDAVHDVLMRRWFTIDAIENEIPGYKYLSKTFKNFNPVTFKKISNAMCNLDTNEKLKDISVPTLIVATPDDPGAPTYISRRMAEYISGSELHWLEPAQHLSSLEHIEPFNLIVKNFLLKQR
ncbi:MAG: alpha/beta hydrolase [Pseudomonadota bacterium]|nr:alpha/beta hydrolase [Pseudomonadota bacterium]MEC8234711.1 alpha/beta hydrolase [Pseudomonadota bacterium]